MNMDTTDGGPSGPRGRGRSTYRGGGGGGGRSNQYYSGGGRGGYGGGSDYQGGGYNQSYGNFNQSNRGGGRGRGYWGGRGRSSARGGRTGRGGDGGRGRGRGSLPEDVESLSELKGHAKNVTCLVLDQGTGQLFTGSHDGTVRVWSCSSGECTNTVQVGGEVDAMLIEAGFLFVGVKLSSGQGVIKGWNMANNAEFHLEGHTGRVQCLAAAGGMLFSGGQDLSIRVWKINPATGGFECAAALLQQHGGHAASPSALCASGPFLFSGDALGTIKVWDLAAGVVRQSLEKAHNASQMPAITSMLVWEGHLITGALDGTIKVWEPSDPSTGNVINPVAVFTFPESQQEQQPQQLCSRSSREKRGAPSKDELPGVLAMCGVADPQGKAVVMVAFNGEKAIKLFEMPTFAERGQLWDVHNVRSMAGFPAGRLMMSGDEHGRVKVWRWKETQPAVGSTPFG